MHLAGHTDKDDRGAALRLVDYDYCLPAELIAQEPAAERDGARLLVLDRSGDVLQHTAVMRLPALLRKGDLLVFNRTRVRPARLFARSRNGAAVELLVVRHEGGSVWHCLGRPAARLREGAVLDLPDGVEASIENRLGGGRYAVRFSTAAVAELIERHGEIPLPPYIKRPDGPLPLDADRYQTVFARDDGAVAAPTAGLHFTPRLLAELEGAGVELAWLTLHVGPATFLPVREDVVAERGLEPEWADIPSETAASVACAKREGRRVIAVGTTSTRALESAADGAGVAPGGRWADAFITQGFRLRVVDALVTNFHLPCSTLLMLVSALAGRERILDAYAVAVAARYRFYSYGDAMLIC